MAVEWTDYVAVGLGCLTLGQGAVIFSKSRRDKANAERRAEDLQGLSDMGKRIDNLDKDLREHNKDDREMHERIGKAEGRLENQQQQINDVNSRHGDLVSRIDEIHQKMLTKDDLKMLVEFLRKP